MGKSGYTECGNDDCSRITKNELCRTCEEDELRRETRETVYMNDVDLNTIHDNRRIRG